MLVQFCFCSLDIVFIIKFIVFIVEVFIVCQIIRSDCGGDWKQLVQGCLGSGIELDCFIQDEGQNRSLLGHQTLGDLGLQKPSG